MMSEFFLFYKEHIGVQVQSSARKTQVERLESFCVIEKIAIDVESLVIEVMVLELSN